MWWGRSENRGSNAFWMIIAIAIAVALFSGSKGLGWSWWMLFPLFFFVIPVIRRAVSCDSSGEKRKNSYEKPKRQPRTFIREDGEVIEVIEEASARKNNPDDIEYV